MDLSQSQSTCLRLQPGFALRSAILLAALSAASAHSAQSQPVISPGGVVSAGLSIPRQPFLSPGAIFSIFGTGFAPTGTSAQVTGADLVNGALPTTLAHVCVEVGGVKAPLFAVYPAQINAQVPSSIPASGATVQVVTGCDSATPATSNGAFVLLQPASPEFFYFQFSSTGDNPVAAFDSTGGGSAVGPGGTSLPFSTAPAKPGDIVVLYATGLGATTPPTPAGTLPASGAQLASKFTVFLGGMAVDPSDILYAGVAPGFAGQYQVNLRIPATAPAGAQNLTLTVAGIPSPPGASLYIASGGCELPQIEAFTAFPKQLASPGSTKISWYVVGASSVSEQPSLGSTATTASVTQNLSSTSTFQLTATNSCGSSTASVTVGVGAPTIAAVQNSAGQPVSSIFAGDTVRLAFQNLGDSTTIYDVVYQTSNGLRYLYPPDSVDASGNIYFTAPVLPEMTFTAPTPVQISVITIKGQQISTNQTLNISLPTYAGNAVQDFTAFLDELAGGYKSALTDLGSATGNASIATTLTSAVMAYLAPLQNAAIQLGSNDSVKITIRPTTSANPNPAKVTLTAQDVGLFMALLGRASIPSPGVSSHGRAAVPSFSTLRAVSGRAEAADASVCPSIQQQVPLIPVCQRLQNVNQYLGNFAKLLGSFSSVAEITGAVAELYAVAGANFALAAGGASLMALDLGVADAAATAYCYSQPIWLDKLILSPNAIPDTSGVANPSSSKVDIRAVLVSQLGPSATNIGEAITDVAAHGFLPKGLEALLPEPAASRAAQLAGGQFVAEEILADFNNLIEAAFPNFSVPGPMTYAVGYCANDLPRDVTFPANITKLDLGQPNFGYNDFFLFGTQQGQAPVNITGNQNNFLFANTFECGLFVGGGTFLCSPTLTVGPPTSVMLGYAEAQANNCTTMSGNNVRLGGGQPLGYDPVNASAESSPESASVNAFQSLPDDWEFTLVANVVSVSNSAACWDYSFGDAPVDSLAELNLTIVYSSPVTVSVKASDCATHSVTPMVGLISATSDHSQDQTLNGNGIVNWTVTGAGAMVFSANAGVASRVSGQQQGETCEISGSIEIASPKGSSPPAAAQLRLPGSNNLK